MASETIHTSLVIKGYCFSAPISHEIMYFKNNHNVEILLLLSVSHGGVFCSEYRSRFCSPKTGEEESKLEYSSFNCLQNQMGDWFSRVADKKKS